MINAIPQIWVSQIKAADRCLINTKADSNNENDNNEKLFDRRYRKARLMAINRWLMYEIPIILVASNAKQYKWFMVFLI